MSTKEMQNLYEVRKTVRFELVPEFIWTDKKPAWNTENRAKFIFENLIKLTDLHSEFVNLLWKTLVNESEKIIKEEENDNNQSKLFSKELWEKFGLSNKESLNSENSKIIDYFYDYEIWSLIQFKYKWLELVFKNDWIENKKKIKYTIDKYWNEKKKNKNYITLTDLW